ncbi:MAG TPA: hemerythrin domain-containing protein [Kofleriaceae bacterium]|nr:hemerythrin domain-containing protein [Kofleriaceae bacterium]
MPNRTDQMMSKGMEAVKAVKATVKGVHGVFRTLMEQHGAVSALLRRVQKDADKRAELWPEIRKELLSHEKGELRIVYPALREHAETRAFADRHEGEASTLESQIKLIDAESIGSPTWVSGFDRLVELVQRHVDFEESEVFPAAMKALGDDRARELDDRFREVKQLEARQATTNPRA